MSDPTGGGGFLLGVSRSCAAFRSISSGTASGNAGNRIDQLRPDSKALWGRMNAHQMICHLRDAIESGFGSSPSTPATGALTRFPIKWLVINVLPWPKGKLQGPPDLFVTKPSDWETDIAALRSALERASVKGPNAEWPASDVFGPMTARDWGALIRTHMNHHFKQFGV